MNSAGLGRDRATPLAVLIALAALTLVLPGSLAQTPASETEAGDGAHPAHIHAGTCAELGDVVVPLADVVFPAGEQTGADTAIPVKLSLNRIDMPLDELLGGEYAINVHQSSEAIDEYIACSDIGGIPTPGEAGGEEIRFVLGELNESGHDGVVFIEGEGDQTEVNIMLIEPDGME
jgi:hypothetical protein